MSISYKDVVLRTKLPQTQKDILLYLTERCNDKGFIVPCHAKVAADCCISLRTVQRAMKGLILAGHLKATKMPGVPTVYKIVKDLKGIASLKAEKSTSEVVSSVSVVDKTLTKSSDTNDTTYITGIARVKPVRKTKVVTEKYCQPCQYFENGSLPPSPPLSSPPNGFPDTPSFTPPIIPPSTPLSPDKPRARVKNEYTEEFLMLWSVYPNGSGKYPAFIAFQKLGLDTKTLADIVDHVEQRKQLDKQWLEQDGRFIPHLSTFLNKRGWEDENNWSRKARGQKITDVYRKLDGSLMPWEE